MAAASGETLRHCARRAGKRVRRCLAHALVAALLPATVLAAPAECVPRGTWSAPGAAGLRNLSMRDVMSDLMGRSVVLLGERHDSAADHRWQLQMIAALHAARPDMVIGLEMFPRRVQPALDRWVAGDLSETEFLRQSDWREVWQMNPDLYLPIFRFARMNRVPMIALNVDRTFTRAVGQNGFDAVPQSEREGVGQPASASPQYRERLHEVFLEHARGSGVDRQEHGAGSSSMDDPAFRHFVESQLVWDRAMAEGIAAALKRSPAPLVVGVLGSGHILNRFGVPHQLEALGIEGVAVLAPWDGDTDCTSLVEGYADAVFGVGTPDATEGPKRQRLGVWLELAAGGVRVREVEKGSIAEGAGVRTGDIVVEVAGLPAKQPGDVAAAVQRQAPGTWLPLKVQRGADPIEIVAKFPPVAP
jgi:uncharacterized iron-regulated protein